MERRYTGGGGGGVVGDATRRDASGDAAAAAAGGRRGARGGGGGGRAGGGPGGEVGAAAAGADVRGGAARGGVRGRALARAEGRGLLRLRVPAVAGRCRRRRAAARGVRQDHLPVLAQAGEEKGGGGMPFCCFAKSSYPSIDGGFWPLIRSMVVGSGNPHYVDLF